MMNRRDAIKGMGFLGLGFLFRGRNKELTPEPVVESQQPSAVDIEVVPSVAFRPRRLVVPLAICNSFIIENITIGDESQFLKGTGIPAACFAPNVTDMDVDMSPAAPTIPIRFRVRYVGKEPAGEEFKAAIIGYGLDGRRAMILPIMSGHKIVA